VQPPPPLSYARFAKVRLSGQHGSEFFCTLSLFVAHGASLLDDFNADLDRHLTRPPLQDLKDAANSSSSSPAPPQDHGVGGGRVTPAAARAQEVEDAAREINAPASEGGVVVRGGGGGVISKGGGALNEFGGAEGVANANGGGQIRG
jgi:hypothetical protein